ncbi:MAG: hypothetical protein OXG85_04290 [Chloroflexi bacterium]|nr:hypothetical protein [Chloroflexota bacterium]
MLMRHDWTLLCTEVQTQDIGALGLGNVFSTLQVYSPLATLEQAETVLFDPPAILVSQWTAEFDADRRVHTATVQLLAPGGEQVMWTKIVEVDFRYQSSHLMMLIMQELQFVGKGTYEYHVVIEEFAAIGEWGRACLTIS